MDFFGKLSVALGIWAVLLMFGGAVFRPFGVRTDDERRHQRFCNLAVTIGLVCGLLCTIVAVLN